jgi:hypothetical protein
VSTSREPTYAELEELLSYAREYVTTSRAYETHLAVRALDRLAAVVDRLDGQPVHPRAAVDG